MGFFSDLKDDLNQAVNEMAPEGELDAADAGEGLSEDNETGQQQESVVTAEALSDMLEAISAESGLEMPEEELTDSGMMELPEAGDSGEVGDSGDSGIEALEAELPDADVPEQETEIPVDGGFEMENYDMEMTAETELSEQPIEEIATESILESTAEEEPLEESEGEENSMEDVMSIESKVVSDETAVVTEGMSITGDITSGGSLELIGNVIGNIEILGKLNITGGIQGNSKAAEIYAEGARINGEVISQGSVKIGQSSVVIGNITANSAVVAGAVKGDIDVHGPVILDTSAIVMGNIKSKSVQINNGAVIEGMCSQCYADVNPTSFFDEINKKSKKKEK